MALYTVDFHDKRGRRHVALMEGATAQEALDRLIAYCEDRHDFDYGPPDLDDVNEVKFQEDPEDPTSNHVLILFHEDYD